MSSTTLDLAFLKPMWFLPRFGNKNGSVRQQNIPFQMYLLWEFCVKVCLFRCGEVYVLLCKQMLVTLEGDFCDLICVLRSNVCQMNWLCVLWYIFRRVMYALLISIVHTCVFTHTHTHTHTHTNVALPLPDVACACQNGHKTVHKSHLCMHIHLHG